MVGPPSGRSRAKPRCDVGGRRGGVWSSPGDVPAAIARRADMFENLGDVEKKGSGRTMKIIWIVIAVAAVILAIVSFA
jgi:hypothetical protein